MIFSAEEMDEIRIDLRRTDGNVNLVAQLHACSAACIRAVQNGQTLVAGRRAGADGRERNSKRLWTEADYRKLRQMTAEGCSIDDIARALDRSTDAVYNRIYHERKRMELC